MEIRRARLGACAAAQVVGLVRFITSLGVTPQLVISGARRMWGGVAVQQPHTPLEFKCLGVHMDHHEWTIEQLNADAEDATEIDLVSRCRDPRQVGDTPSPEPEEHAKLDAIAKRHMGLGCIVADTVQCLESITELARQGLILAGPAILVSYDPQRASLSEEQG